MNNVKTAKIVVAALLVTLIADNVILIKMLVDEHRDLMNERQNAELYKREYRRVIDRSCMEHAELTSRIHELEWRLEEL